MDTLTFGRCIEEAIYSKYLAILDELIASCHDSPGK